MTRSALRCLSLLAPVALLSGCQKFTVLVPSGYVAAQQRDILIASVVLMMIIVIPLFVALFIIARRYRESNRDSAYAPDWSHSTRLELLMWAVPLAIVVILGAITWTGTHRYAPYSELRHINHEIPVDANMTPLKVDVVALNWKWLFLYPQYGIATVGEVAAPINVPINFRITASDLMNSFYIPALAGQIYAMPGMRTKLNAVINEPGKYKGVDANYSGEGFNYMDFSFIGMKHEQFKQWVAKIKSGDKNLTRKTFRATLLKDSINVPVKYYAQYADGLFRSIVQRCFAGSAKCQGGHQMHKASAQHDMTVSMAGEKPTTATARD